MNFRLIIFLLLLITAKISAQSAISIQNFSLLKHITLEGEYFNSRGLLAQFKVVATDANPQPIDLELSLIVGGAYVLKQTKKIKWNKKDSFLQYQLPYRLINLEEGLYNVQLLLKVKGEKHPTYRKKFRIKQPKVFDLFLELKEATIQPDSGYNPIGLLNSVPDPIWAVKIHNEQKKGLVQRNSFEPLPYQLTTTITRFDTVAICIFDDDPLTKGWLGCYQVDHGTMAIEKEFENQAIGERITSSFSFSKLERKVMTSEMELVENHIHKGVKGLKIIFSYDLPYHYRKKSIRIKIQNSLNQLVENIIPLKEDRQQIKNRIVGNYDYFIPYYSLQDNAKIALKLKANKMTIKQYFIDSLVVPKTVDDITISQKTAYKHEGISGILYRLDYELPALDKQAELFLDFPTLSKSAIAKIKYWSASDPSQIRNGNLAKIPTLKQQTIFVFLPYFVSPKKIHLRPKLLLKNTDVPTIEVVSFESKPYLRPNELNDIHIEVKKTIDYNYTGLGGVLFVYNISIPDYYHSKGDFILQILANGKPMEDGFFIDDNSYAIKKQKIKNQKKIKVFIPYRAMQSGQKYEVKLEAISQNFALAMAQTETYDNPIFAMSQRSLYIAQLHIPNWKNVVCKLGIRNFKNINQTYMHLGYHIIAKDTFPASGKIKMPKAYLLKVHHLDEIVFWIKEEGKHDDTAQIIKTSVAALLANNNELKFKNKGNIKNFLLKLVKT